MSISALSTLHRPPLSSTSEPWLLVLLHGFGSHEQDLFGLAGEVPDDFHVVSVRAPHDLGFGGFAWFNLEPLPQGGYWKDEAQEQSSRTQLVQWLKDTAQALNVPAQRIVVAGFSQGGMMALTLLLTHPELMQGALVWHGSLLPHTVVHHAPASALTDKQLWISHGLSDAVLPISLARTMRDYCQTLPLKLQYHEFQGEHTIPMDELEQSVNWLESLTR